MVVFGVVTTTGSAAPAQSLTHQPIDRLRPALPCVSLQSFFAANFLATFKEFPPRQKPSGFTIDQVMEKLAPPTG